MKVEEAYGKFAEARNAVVLGLTAVHEALGTEDFKEALKQEKALPKLIVEAQAAKAVVETAISEHPDEAPETTST